MPASRKGRSSFRTSAASIHVLKLMLAERFSGRKYLLTRKLFKLVGADFRITDEAGNLVLFVHQKGFRLKEDIRVYADESKGTELLTIRARQIIDFAAAYDVIDASTGEKLGAMKRKGWKSIVRDEWIIMNSADMEIGTVVEDSMVVALVRRFLTNLVPQSFDVLMGGQKVCDLTQSWNPFLFKLNIDFAAGPEVFDRRLGLAVAVLISAIEGRQRG
jgi:uncharacterized protein YxjI